MELDRTTGAVMEDCVENIAGEWRHRENGQADELSLLCEVERHIQALRQLDCWIEAVPLPWVRESIGHMGIGRDCPAALQWQAGALTERPQSHPLNEASMLFLRLLAAELAWALDHAHLLEMTYQMAVTDGLTGLFNRRHFDQRLAEESLRGARYGHPLSLIMLDIDHFKLYNDQCGHAEGDRILVQLAHLLAQCVRRTDILARYGGDEFAVLLPETDAEGAGVVGDKVRCAVHDLALWPLPREPSWVQDGHGAQVQAGGESSYYQVTISAGVATSQSGSSSAAELVACADWALYRAKSMGRDRIWGPVVLAGAHTCPGCRSVGESA